MKPIDPPGKYLRAILADLGWTQTILAEVMGRPKKTVCEIMNGKTGITADTALDLEQAMQVSADFWIRQEGLYRVYLARMKRDNKG